MSSFTHEEKFIISSFRTMFGDVGYPRKTMDPRAEELICLLVELRVRYFFDVPFKRFILFRSIKKYEILDLVDESLESEGITPLHTDFAIGKTCLAFLLVVFKRRHMLSAEDNQQLLAILDLAPAAKKVPKPFPRVVDSDEEDDD